MQGTRQGTRQRSRRAIMSRIPEVILAAALTVATSAVANAAEPIALRDMGSFHVGGRLVEISGKPVKEVTFTPGGVPAKVLKNIPTLIVYGDYIERDSRWPKIRATGIAFAEGIKAAGGSVDVVDLPKAGISGNSHMMMMDKNNTEIAALIQTWLEGKGLTKKP